MIPLVFACSTRSEICTERLQGSSCKLDDSCSTNQKLFLGLCENYGERIQSSYKPQGAEENKQQLILFTGSKLSRVPKFLNSKWQVVLAHGCLSEFEGVLYFQNILDTLGNFALSLHQLLYDWVYIFFFLKLPQKSVSRINKDSADTT